MAILPAGFSLPPLPYLAVLVGSVLAVVGVLYRDSPPVTERVVLAGAPWMVTGSSLYVLYQVDAVPAVVAPFFGSPAVYCTTFVFLGALWISVSRLTVGNGSSATDRTGADSTAANDSPTTARTIGVVGIVLALAAVSLTLAVGAGRGSLEVVWPVVGLCVSIALAAATWLAVRGGQAGETGWAGALVVFAHTLDGVSTAVGVDILGFGEQTPLARAFLDVAASLPGSEFLGTGWLFIAVKIALAVVIVWLLADTVRERPREGYLFCAFVAAVGLGPGAHNLLLFTVAG